jgi:hypothetical protein
MQANHKMKVAALALSYVAIMVSGIGAGFAQNAVSVRGTIDHIDGSTYLIKARDGAELKVALAENPQIADQGIRHQAGLTLTYRAYTDPTPYADYAASHSLCY